jgi:hypothetical protein
MRDASSMEEAFLGDAGLVGISPERFEAANEEVGALDVIR